LFFYELPETKRGAQLKRNQLQHFSAWQLSVKGTTQIFDSVSCDSIITNST
jgi:hypothetical protein